ncbi:MAG: DUF695 domain-containing protein [Archangium sp.]
MPTQHDHYVPTASGMLKIFRGAQGPTGGHEWEAGEKPFPFKPEHAWLKDAVVLPWEEARVMRGTIEDGAMEDVLVFEGGDDGLAFHHACWELQGSPGSTGPAFRANETHQWAIAEAYHEQLFDFEGLVADGNEWMLEEPKPGTRSRARIDAMLKIPEAKTAVESIEESVRVDRDWSCMPSRDEDGRKGIARARMYTVEKVEKTGYGTLVRLSKFYEEPRLPGAEELQELQTLELALKAAVEKDVDAIFVLAAIGRGRAEYLTYARDGEKTKAVIAALPGVSSGTLEVSSDPNWQETRKAITSLRG